MMKATDMMYKHLISLDGIEGTINGKKIKFLATDNEITTDEPLLEGSFIIINGIIYLVTEIKNKIKHGLYNIGQFEKTLPILLGSTLKPVQAVVTKYRGQFVDGTYIDEVHDQYTFKISKNDSNMNTQSIGADAIVYDGGLYNILSVDNTHDGILVITVKYDTVYVPHTYSITLNSTSQSIVETGIYELIASVTDNGITVSNPIIIWTSSNPEIATVSSTGLVTGVLAGSSTITGTYMNSVSATLNLTVAVKPSEPVINYTYSWSNTTVLKYMSSTTFTVTKTIDGVVDPTLIIAFAWDSVGAGLVSGSKVTMTKKTDASWTIKNTNVQTITNCILTWKDASTGTVILSAPFQFRYMS